MGPALKLTRPLAKKIFAKLERGHYVRSACASVGIHHSTLYAWKELGTEARVLRDQEPDPADTAAHAAWQALLDAKRIYLDFLEGVELASDKGEAWLLDQIIEMCADPDVRNNKWTGFMTVLERTRRDRWGRRSAVEHGTPDGKPFPVSHVFDPSKLSTDELEQLKLLLERAKPDDQ